MLMADTEAEDTAAPPTLTFNTYYARTPSIPMRLNDVEVVVAVFFL